MKTRILTALCLVFLAVSIAHAQDYRNVVNTRFNTVSNGPLGAIVVDVPNANDPKAVTAAVVSRVNAVRKSRAGGMQRYLAALRKTLRAKGELSLGIPDVVYVRQQGRLAVPSGKTRSHDPNNSLQFTFPITQAAGDGGWTAQQADELTFIANTMNTVLRTEYGAPFWNGTVTVTNADNQTPIMSDPNAISGGVYNVSQSQILFAVYNHVQSRVLNLTQMMALAYRGPASIAYDAWERGMARAATLEAVRTALPALEARFGANSIDVADPLWQVMDRYDLMNQPPLGNDRFMPQSKVNGVANTSSFPNMLIPRLVMAGTAWLKVAAESPSFFSTFNQAYYDRYDTDHSTQNNIPVLRQIAQQALSGGQVEGLAFNNWYERQYVLDTSVTVGTKLFAEVAPFRPDPADDDFAYAIILHYFQTTLSGGVSDELNLNGVSYPIFTNFAGERQFLAAQYERVDIREGIGAFSPTFFDTINGSQGDPQLNGRMRVTIDLPVNNDNVRIQGAPRSMGTLSPPVSYFWGAVVGADTGKMKIETETGVTAEYDVKQGAWGGTIDSNAFSRPNRATLTFTDANGVVAGQRRVNLGYASTGDPATRITEFTTAFYVNDPVTSLTHTFPAGPAMISFPIQPLRPRAQDALLNPATDLPLFDETNLLMAQWRQSLPTEDKYVRYPSMEPLAPGKGYWENFGGPTPVKVNGKTFNQEREVSIGLLHGWNQIGNPFQSPISVSSLKFQYLADNVPVDLATAISKGWIVATNVPLVGEIAVWDFSPASGYIKADTLEPWKGYWIRVLVSEGITITYPNPNLESRAARLTRAVTKPVAGWSVGLTLRAPNGLGATAYLGQSDQATTGYDARMDTSRPPDFTRAAPSIAFPHPDWGANAGDYFADVRQKGSRDPWEVTVYTPEPDKTYTLSWSNLAGVPRTTRLMLEDVATGKKQYLQTSSGYSFTPGSAATRKFRILVEDRGRTPLRILDIQARPTRAAGGASAMQIGYNLTQGATVTVEIRGADGRVVRKLSQGRAADAGQNSVIWDTKDERAASVPQGTYLVQVIARTPEGDSARMIQPVLIVR